MDKEDNDLIMKELDKMSSINNVNISNKKDYELNLSMEELQKRTLTATIGANKKSNRFYFYYPCIFKASIIF